ncbi:BA75_04465T0 [Komagataella pastoris]|uniref:Lactoylglutathione lyase n=1 Tax=Komagataella pastoris TaxID=4922 RepID=A0A1B2JHM3_PICPA|nr:BA75_04465T0 [Komagataella pastoris]
MPAIVDPSFQTNHVCLHVSDIEKSIKFYTEYFGLSLLARESVPQLKKEIYLLGYNSPSNANYGKHWADRNGVLELCVDQTLPKDYKFANGNSPEAQGFGHICVAVDNLETACEQLEKNGVAFKKRPSEGRQKDIAFALDPDNYWIELIEHQIGKQDGVAHKNTWVLNHGMYRIRDPKVSLKFYKEVLGMKLYSTREFPEAKFTLFFLGYEHDDQYVENQEKPRLQAERESIIELTHNWGTESDPSFKGYHTNTTEPFGYGHTGIKTKDVAKLAKDLENDVQWVYKLGDISDKFAFFKDPDGYLLEILQNDSFFKEQGNKL